MKDVAPGQATLALDALSPTKEAASTGDGPSTGLSLADGTKAHCHRLLGEAVTAVGGHAGAIFAVHGRDQLDLVVTDQANHPNEHGVLESAAHHALAQGRALFVEPSSQGSSGPHGPEL